MIEAALRRLRADLAPRAGDVLLRLPGTQLSSLTRRDGFLPLLVDYTREDREAKGLRKIADPGARRPPDHFSAVEIVAAERAVLLTAPHGSGKTAFALDLALHLAGARLEIDGFSLAGLTRPVVRNEGGLTRDEAWDAPIPLPFHVPCRPGVSLGALLDEAGVTAAIATSEPVLLILDDLQVLGRVRGALLAELADRLAGAPQLRLLLLGETEQCRAWALPEGFARQSLRPLLAAQRLAHAARCARALGEAPPGARWAERGPDRAELFMLSLALPEAIAGEDALIDAWLERDVPDRGALEARARDAFAGWAQAGSASGTRSALLECALTARHLARLDLDAVVALVADDAARWAPPVSAHGRRLADHMPLVRALAALPADRASWGCLTAARLLAGCMDPASWAPILPGLVAATGDRHLVALLRDEAAQALARQGDPRALDALCAVPGGVVRMGTDLHPNSRPVHDVAVARFRIGRYPVTNALYGRFADATGHAWASPERHAAARRNAPATDLTWHDATAFCAWLTSTWRAEGRLAAGATVRLPTEPEWEFAARGLAAAGQGQGPIAYPWSWDWRDDHANSVEAGFNAPTAVGLWPWAASPFGVEDLAGQVWEWTSTLWGEDMARPAWTYPYKAGDGRELAHAAPAVRRVLRGGCFSSNKLKANCSYRGSLEPAGFWRGNGFRIVVA